MKQLEIKKQDKITTNNTGVFIADEKEYNTNHEYVIKNVHDDTTVQTVKFQKGPIKEVGVNGAHNEDYIAIVINRLESFQESEYACEENDIAIEHLYAAMDALRERTIKRAQRGVLGTSIV